MQIRQLRYFLKVAELGSITAAAKELHMTQPALSRQIRAFEDDCGWNLIDRGAKSIRLTKAGLVVVKEGTSMIQEVDSRLTRMQNAIEGGAIHIGYAPSLAGDLLKKAMGCYVQRHPNVRLILADSTSEEMRIKLQSGELDLVIGALTNEDGVEWATLNEKKLSLAVPRSNPLAKKRSLTANELDGQRILLLSRHEYPEYFKGVTSYFQAQGINAKVAGEFDGIESLRVALEAGIGIALVAEGARVGKDVKLLPVTPAPTPVCVAVGWRSGNDLAPEVAAFVEELKMVGG